MENVENGLERENQGTQNKKENEGGETKDLQTQEPSVSQDNEAQDEKEQESTENGDTNAKTEVAKDCTNLYPNDDSSTNDSSFVSHRLSTNPSYTQEEATAIAVLKESRLAKTPQFKDYAKPMHKPLQTCNPMR